jgi:hypothetical protein
MIQDIKFIPDEKTGLYYPFIDNNKVSILLEEFQVKHAISMLSKFKNVNLTDNEIKGACMIAAKTSYDKL